MAHDAADPTGRMLVDVLGTLAEFRAGLIPLRMREGITASRLRGRLWDKRMKVRVRRQADPRRKREIVECSTTNLADLPDVVGLTVYRVPARGSVIRAASTLLHFAIRGASIDWPAGATAGISRMAS